jgi:hypothetical protein
MWIILLLRNVSVSVTVSVTLSLILSLSHFLCGWVGGVPHWPSRWNVYECVSVCACLCVSRMYALTHTQASLLPMTEACVKNVLYNVVLHENMYVYMYNVFSSSYN